MNWLAKFAVSAFAGGAVAVVGVLGGTSAIKSSQANTGSDKPPSDVNSVNYADE